MLATRPICRKRFYLATAAQSCRSFTFRPTPPSPSLRDWLRTSAWVNSVTDKIPYRIIRKSDVELGIDDEFNRLPALEQIRRAMHGPVPTELPQLRNDRLEALLFKGKDLWPLSEREERDFREAYHRERLEFVGDRIWEEVVVLVLFSLAPIQRLPTKTAAPSLGHFQNETSRLTTNEMAARLAREFKLDQRLHTTAIADLADGWEAYLTALFFSNGRRAVLEFLAPIIKREFFEVHRPSDALPPLVFERLSTSPSRPLLTGLPSQSTRPAVPPTSIAKPAPPSAPAPSSITTVSPAKPPPTATAPSPPMEKGPSRSAFASMVASAKSLEISALAEIEPLRFRTIVEATSNLLAELDRQKIPRCFEINDRYVALTLPGYPRIFTPASPRKTRMRRLLAMCIAQGSVVIDPKLAPVASDQSRKMTAMKRMDPLRFPTLAQAIDTFFQVLSQRNVPHYSETKEGQFILTLAGFPPVSAPRTPKSGRRRRLVEQCIAQGSVVIDPALSPAPSDSNPVAKGLQANAAAQAGSDPASAATATQKPLDQAESTSAVEDGDEPTKEWDPLSQAVSSLDTASSDAPSDTSPATAPSTSPSEPSSSSAFTLAATTSSSSRAPSASAPLPGDAEALLLSEAPPPAPSPADEPSHSFSFSDELGEPVEEISTPEAGSALTSVVSPDTEDVPSPPPDESSQSLSLSGKFGEPTEEPSVPGSDSALPSVVYPETEDVPSPPADELSHSFSLSDELGEPTGAMSAPDSDSARPSVVSPVTEDGPSPSAAPPHLIFTTASPSSNDAPVSPSPSPVDQSSDPSSSLSASEELQTAITDEKVAVDLGDDPLEHEHVEVAGSSKTTAMDEPEQAGVDSEGVASDGPPAIAVTVQGGAQSSDGAVAIEPMEEEVAKEEKDDRKQEGPDGGKEDDEKKH